jgi:hypothetical protein
MDFHTSSGLFESLGMAFRLTNNLAVFQNFINAILAPDVDRFCMAYLDGPLIYSYTFDEH